MCDKLVLQGWCNPGAFAAGSDGRDGWRKERSLLSRVFCVFQSLMLVQPGVALSLWFLYLESCYPAYRSFAGYSSLSVSSRRCNCRRQYNRLVDRRCSVTVLACMWSVGFEAGREVVVEVHGVCETILPKSDGATTDKV